MVLCLAGAELITANGLPSVDKERGNSHGDIALRYSGRIQPTGFQLAAKIHEDGTTTSIKKGGTMIEYEDEDPEIRRRFDAELQKAGMRSDMPPVACA
jgi:hypothetical protein